MNTRVFYPSSVFYSSRFSLLALALLINATLMSGSAWAVNAVGGSSRNIDVTVGTAWTVLTSVNFANPTQRYCTATGSADVFRPTRASGQYRYLFTVSNSPNPPFDQGQERALEFLNQGNILDNSSKEITTTGGWMSNAMANPGYFTVAANPLFFGSRTIYFLARKATAATPNLVVADASMTVTCTDSYLAPPLIIFNPVPVVPAK